MNKFILCLFIAVSGFQCSQAQTQLPQIYLNHVYVVLDSNTYTNLFEDVFITQKLGDTKVSSTSTTEGSWSGKYVYGRNGYFEFFSTKGLSGSSTGDFGLGFMTFKAGDIGKIEKYWKQNSSDSIEKDTTTYLSGGKSQSWFYSIGLFRKDSTAPVSTWIMENTPEELQFAGFSAAEMKNEIRWQTYMEKLAKTLFTKSFDRIKSVQLSLNNKQYRYLKKSLLGFGLQKKGNTFFNNHIKISYTITTGAKAGVTILETELTESFPDTTIKISDKLAVQVAGNKAIWKFSY